MNLRKFDTASQEAQAPWVGLRELTELRPMSAPTVRRWMNHPNGIPFRKLGRKILFNLAEVDLWLASMPSWNAK